MVAGWLVVVVVLLWPSSFSHFVLFVFYLVSRLSLRTRQVGTVVRPVAVSFDPFPRAAVSLLKHRQFRVFMTPSRVFVYFPPRGMIYRVSVGVADRTSWVKYTFKEKPWQV